MSLFQCDICGCIDNTTTSNMGGYDLNIFLRDVDSKEAVKSYKKVLGLKPDEKFGKYCCIHSPVWFKEQKLGIGKKPEDQKVWHNKFDRKFLPKGEWETVSDGNLQHKIYGKILTDSFESEKEYDEISKEASNKYLRDTIKGYIINDITYLEDTHTLTRVYKFIANIKVDNKQVANIVEKDVLDNEIMSLIKAIVEKGSNYIKRKTIKYLKAVLK
jgi:hypothetical protein